MASTSTRALRRRPLGLGLALALGGLAGSASAQVTSDPDIRDVRPVVMLLVDTSGSMERVPGGAEGSLPMCAGSPAGTNERNRWNTVVEALTGTWNDTDYFCTAVDRSAYGGFEDFNYYLPYHQPPLAVPQNQDGVLDVYSTRIKFGLMTFDATYTFIDMHPLLVERATFLGRHPGMNHSNFGGYSYGEPRPLEWAGCPDEFMVDSGSRNEDAPAGALVSVGLETDDYQLINQTIQTQLRGVRPFGGTPIAGMLDDLQYYFDNHPDVTADDPFEECRSRVAILLTDGHPDADFRDSRFDCDGVGGTCPYALASETAAELCQYSSTSGLCNGDLQSLFVVAFDVTDAAAVAELNAIADAGGTGSALLASDRDELIRRLAEALDRAAPGNTTRSRPAFVVGGSTFGAGATPTQLEFNAGFRVGLDGAPWRGILERTRYLCNASNEPEAEPVEDRVRFDLRLNENDDRTLYTVLTPDPADMSGNMVGEQATTVPLNATPATGVVSDRVLTAFDTAIDPGYFGIPSGADAASRRDHVVQWVHGLTADRDEARMGDIYHSSPVAVSPPRVDIADESYNLFRAQPTVADRPTIVYVGTNDGVLHAFVAEDWSLDGETYEAGDELWGFIPPIMVPKLESATNSHQIMLDGAPVVKDVFYRRLPGSQPAANLYHTVLVMGFRGGARGYFALDITNPLEPEFLWQFVGEPDGSGDTPMGNSFGLAAVGQALVEVNGVLQERAIAVLPGGEGELDVAAATAAGDAGCALGADAPATTVGTTGPRSSVRCWQERGRALTFLDVGTGEILRTFDASAFSSPITGSVALYPGDVGTVARRAFVTDADGVLWSANLTARDPDEWETRGLHDIFWDAGATVGQPGYYPPSVTSDEQGNLVILQATGDIDRLDSVAYNRVVSVTEVVTFGMTGEPAYSSDLNWEIRLLEGEQVTGPIELFEGVAYFASFESASDPTNLCELGQSRIWGVDYLEAGATAPSPYDDPIGGFFPVPRYPDGLGDFDHFIGPFDDRLILGVGITQRPTCITGESITDPYIGTRFRVNSVGGGQFQLTAQMSGGDSAGGGAIQTITQTLETPPSFSTVQGFAGNVDY